MRKAAISTMSNIAEGFERDGKREFVQFLAIAKGSVGEIQSQLYVARDQGFLREAEFEEMFAAAREVGRTIAGLMRYLRSASIPGAKYSVPRTRN